MADYSKYRDDSWLTNNNWGKWGEDDEVGALNDVTPQDVVMAASYKQRDSTVCRYGMVTADLNFCPMLRQWEEEI